MNPSDFSSEESLSNGVRKIVIPIPGESRQGVLSPELLDEMQSGTENGNSFSAALAKAFLSGDYSVLREMPAQDRDLTTEPIVQREFTVTRAGAEIPVTVYCSESAKDLIKPAVVYFHGGGWRYGSRQTVCNALRLLAQYSSAAVFSVEYRLAPEYLFPCATDDCWAVLKYVYSHARAFNVDRRHISVSGDSAGGNLAAACARRDRNMRTGMIDRQVLIYPVVCLTEPTGLDYHFSPKDYDIAESQRKWILPAINSMKIATGDTHLYTASHADDCSPDASPLLDHSFAGLPPTTVICAEFDYLTQQDITYATRLASAGVDTTLVIFKGMTHGFMNKLGICPQAQELVRIFAESITLCDKADS